MANPQQMLQLLAQQRQRQQELSKLQAAPSRTNLLNEGQSFGDFFSNPTDAQRQGLLSTGLALLAGDPYKSTGANVASALQAGLGTLANARAANRQGRIDALTSQIEQGQQTFDNLSNVQKAQLAQQKFGFDQQKGEGEPWQFADGRVVNLREDATGVLRDAQGNAVDTAAQGLTPFRAPATQVNIGGGEPSAFETELDKQDAREFIAIEQAGASGASRQSDIQRFRELNETGLTGFAAETINDARKAAQLAYSVFGEELPAEALAATATLDGIKSLTQNFVADRIGDTKGSVSDAEMKTFKESVLNAANSTEGNRMVANFMEATAVADQEKAAFYERWRQTHTDRSGRPTIRGAASAWNKYINDFPKTSGTELSPGNFGQWEGYISSKGKSPSFQGANGKTITMSQIKETAKARGMSEGQVINMLRQNGAIQ